MAERAALAHASITIVDLLDTATYIYYANDASGSGAIAAPEAKADENLKYIGIYDGPTFANGRPIPGEEDFEEKWGVADFCALTEQWTENNQWSGWQRLMGERGYGCVEYVYYAITDDGSHPPIDGDTTEGIDPFYILTTSQYEGEDIINFQEFQDGARYYFDFDEDANTGSMILTTRHTKSGQLVSQTFSQGQQLSGASTIWLATMPEAQPGKYLWAKHVQEYGDGTADVWYDVTRFGEDGEPGNGLSEMITRHQYWADGDSRPPIEDEEGYVADNWYSDPQLIPQQNRERYLWTWYRWTYTDGETPPSDSFSVSYQGQDGVNGTRYSIEANQNEVLCFYMTDEGHAIETSPKTLEVSVFEYGQKDHINLTLGTPTNFKFGYISSKGVFKSLLESKFAQYCRLGITGVEEDEEGVKSDTGEKEGYFYFLAQDFLEMLRANPDSSSYAECYSDLIRTSPTGVPINVSLKFAFLDEKEEEAAVRILTLKEGAPSEILQFKETASKISMAIQSSAMEFTEKGLSIYGAGFEMWNAPERFVESIDTAFDAEKIYYVLENEKYRPVPQGTSYDDTITYYEKTTPSRTLYADEHGDLHISGILEATKGCFSGTVEAEYATFQAGEIGGFSIEKDALTSKSFVSYPLRPLDLHRTYYVLDGDDYIPALDVVAEDERELFVPTLSLQGGSGRVYAQNLTLGQEAVIDDQLIFYDDDGVAKAFIYNPEKHNNMFLKAGEFEVDTRGVGRIGNISFSGLANASVIKGVNWSISDTEARFNNVTVSGTIKTAVFQTSQTQAVGSGMAFMPSYPVTVLEGRESIQPKDYPPGVNVVGAKIWLVQGNDYQLFTITKAESDNKVFFLDRPIPSGFDPIALLFIGMQLKSPQIVSVESEEEWTDSASLTRKDGGIMVFGVNSSGASFANGHILGRGLTITTFGQAEKPNLFLGDLASVAAVLEEDYSGYGLYSDNVYLNGSITTKVGEGSYAGVDTLNNALSTQFEDDQSRIVFWAGAKSTKADDVCRAPFQVTEDGSVYAARAKLTDSLLVGSVIKTAEIQTAIVRGVDKAGNASILEIFDTSAGIRFKTSEDNNILFSIKAADVNNSGNLISGLCDKNDKFFVSINAEDEVTVSGKRIKTDDESYYLALESQTIEQNSQTVIVPSLVHRHGTNQSCGLYFEGGKTTYKLTQGSSEHLRTVWTPVETKMIGTFTLSENQEGNNLQYKPVNGGYDLYVS